MATMTPENRLKTSPSPSSDLGSQACDQIPVSSEVYEISTNIFPEDFPTRTINLVPIAPETFNRYDHGRVELQGWKPHQHPEGALYFVDEAKAGVDLVIDIVEHSTDAIECGYYFVDQEKRVIFWLDEFPMSQLGVWRRVPGILTHTHAPTTHATLRSFPVKFKTVSGSRNRVAGDDCIQHRSIDRGSASALARERFYHFHGEYCARLDKENSVYPSHPRKCSIWFMWVVNILLLNAPIGHLRALRLMYMDELISFESWNKFQNKLHSEWNDLVLYATLILNANVGFLALPQPSESTIAGTSAPQLASYMSIFFGLGSILLGLLLSRQYRVEQQDALAVQEPAKFFQGRAIIGLEGLAIFYSMPYAFMMWGMTTFILAVVLLALESSSGAGQSLLAVVSSVICAALVGHLVDEKATKEQRQRKGLEQHSILFSRATLGQPVILSCGSLLSPSEIACPYPATVTAAPVATRIPREVICGSGHTNHAWCEIIIIIIYNNPAADTPGQHADGWAQGGDIHLDMACLASPCALLSVALPPYVEALVDALLSVEQPLPFMFALGGNEKLLDFFILPDKTKKVNCQKRDGHSPPPRAYCARQRERARPCLRLLGRAARNHATSRPRPPRNAEQPVNAALLPSVLTVAIELLQSDSRISPQGPVTRAFSARRTKNHGHRRGPIGGVHGGFQGCVGIPRRHLASTCGEDGGGAVGGESGSGGG
ncbi:hypothetical protein B0H13DRAFT_2275959 [Mycena leptocephala]|nr:hypothetical protein B0H13DRAFT_2275959 [Mycena leptocephala]